MKATTNTGSREIVSYNNGDAQHLSSADSKLFAESHVSRRNPLSIVNRILPALSPIPLPNFAADQIFSFTRNGIDLTRETELTRSRNESRHRGAPVRGISARVPRISKPFSLSKSLFTHVLQEGLHNKSVPYLDR